MVYERAHWQPQGQTLPPSKGKGQTPQRRQLVNSVSLPIFFVGNKFFPSQGLPYPVGVPHTPIPKATLCTVLCTYHNGLNALPPLTGETHPVLPPPKFARLPVSNDHPLKIDSYLYTPFQQLLLQHSLCPINLCMYGFGRPVQ